MVDMVQVGGADPTAVNYAQDIVKTYNEQGGAAAAKKMRETMERPDLTDKQRTDIFKMSGQATHGMADQLGQGAHGDLKNGQAGGNIDTEAEYNGTVADMSATFQILGTDHADFAVDANGKPVLANGQPTPAGQGQDYNPTNDGNAAARAFSGDVFDSMNLPQAPGKTNSAQYVMGNYGKALTGSLQQPGVFTAVDPKTGMSQPASPVLAQSASYAMGEKGNGKGLYAFGSDERGQMQDQFIKTLSETKAAPMKGTITNDDTLFGTVLNRPDVQSLYLTPEQMKLPPDQRMKLTVEAYKKSPEGQKLDWGKLGDKNKDGNFVEGRDDPDFLGTGEEMVFSNQAGQTLVLSKDGTKNPVPTSAKDIADAPLGDQGKKWDEATANMTPQQKKELQLQLLNSGKDLSEDVYKKMGFDDKSAKALGNEGGRKDDTGMNDGRAIYASYVAMNGDPAKFDEWMKGIGEGEDADHDLRMLAIHSQGFIDDSDDGKKFTRGSNDDGNFFDTRNSAIGAADLDTTIEYVAALKSTGIKAPSVAEGKEDLFKAEGS